MNDAMFSIINYNDISFDRMDSQLLTMASKHKALKMRVEDAYITLDEIMELLDEMNPEKIVTQFNHICQNQDEFVN